MNKRMNPAINRVGIATINPIRINFIKETFMEYFFNWFIHIIPASELVGAMKAPKFEPIMVPYIGSRLMDWTFDRSFPIKIVIGILFKNGVKKALTKV